MVDQYFGTKELYEVVIKANNPMTFGHRHIETGEPILYFDNVHIAMLTEQNRPVIARGGWGNMPRVIWEDRSEVRFSLTEGVMTSTGLGMLMSARMLERGARDVIYIPKKEVELELSPNNKLYLQETPSLDKPIFCYTYERGVIQEKQQIRVEGKSVIVENGDQNKQYLVDYYFEYGEEALVYVIEQERFNGTFSLEGKFYTKDENEGENTTNILVMPKVRIVSDISLRLGERADPTTSVFNIIAMPQQSQYSQTMIMDILRLDKDIDADI